RPFRARHSQMIASGLVLLVAATASVSSLTVHTHTQAPLCVDLHCPAIALDLGEQRLINEETFSKEQCESCAQCTNHGYSVCLRLASAARSPGTRRCSCAHSTPANCHNEVMPAAQRPVNITMSLFNICYLSSIQSPPKPLATQEKNSVIATVESFWTEPYWKTLELDNLTLHYEYIVQAPEHCDGEVRTAEGALGSAPTHTCTAQIPIAMSGAGAEGGKKETNDDYEHSEGYDTYDDELPPEVQFDREVFHFAKEVKFFYRVNVRRPRQLTKESTSDPFRDIKTEVDSETLHYELRPYKKNEHKTDGEKSETPTESEEEDFPEKTDFFAEDKKEDEARKKLRDRAQADKARLHVTGSHHHFDEDEKDANVITSEHAEVVVSGEETTTVSASEEDTEIEAADKSVEKESEDGWQEVKPTSDELITEDLLSEHSLNTTEVHSGTSNSTETTNSAEDGDEEEEGDDVTSTLEPSESAEVEKEIEEEEENEDDGETTTVDGEEEEEDATTSEPANDDVEQSEEEPSGTMVELKKLFLSWFDPTDKWGLAKLCLAVTLGISLIIIGLTCLVKRDKICGKTTTKTAGGYTYNAAAQQTRPLVVEPTREPLNQ
ncbi:hypothetical protein PENTCL1PPCAC_18709, partial [Pristionchus entomophagus]